MKSPFLAAILRWMTYAAAFMPLIIFSDYLSPFHFGKVVVFRGLVEVMLALYLLLVWQYPVYRPRRNAVVISFILFGLAFAVATLTSVSSYTSFWGTLERMGGLWSFWHYIIFLVIITSVLRTRDEWYHFLYLSILTSVLSALYGFGQKTNISFFIGSGGRERIFGTIGNPALFAGYEIINFFLALALYVRAQLITSKKVLLISAICFDGLAIIMTVVRGSVLGLGVGLFVFAALHYSVFRSSVARKAILALAAGAAIFFVILVTPIKDIGFISNSPFLSRFTDTSFDTFTAKTRFWAWQAGLNGWNDTAKTIFLGWGPENFNIPFSIYFNPRFFTGLGAETLFDRAHNMFVEVLVTMGLLGLLTYVGIFGVLFKKLVGLIKKKSEYTSQAIGLISLLIAYIIHNFFIFDTSANLLLFFSVAGFIMYISMPPDHEPALKTSPRAVNSGLVFIVGAVLAVATTVLIYKTNVIPAKANHALTRAIVKGWVLDDQVKREKQGLSVAADTKVSFLDVIAQYKVALAYGAPGKYEYRHRLAQYLLDYTSRTSESPELTDAVKYAIVEIEKNIKENPIDYLPELYASRLNIVLGKSDPASPYNDIALTHSRRALELSPTFVRTFYEIGQAYLNKKDFDTAAGYFRKAIELNPDVGLSYWYLGIVDMNAGGVNKDLKRIALGSSEADEALVKGYNPSEGDLLRLVDPYLRLGNYQKLVELHERLIKMSPSKPEYYTALAFAYAKVGKIDEALATARKAVQLSPSLLNAAREFARGLGRDLGM